MKTIGRVLLFLSSIGLIMLAVSFVTNNSAEATNPQLVTVTNTPLPVQGSISVANTPSVNIANTPGVNIANTSVPVTGNVNVTNALDSKGNPMPLVVTPQALTVSDWCEPEPGSETCSLSAVPQGMRLVIQEVDMAVSAASGVNVYNAEMDTQLNSKTAYHQFVLTNQGNDSFTDVHFATHQQTTIYADTGSQPVCSIAGNTTGNIFLRCTYSGYLVPAQ
jgi:hypothetical protein